MKRFLSIGECMLELSAQGADLWRLGIAGDTLNTAWYARACLPVEWHVAYGTVIGRDDFSARVPRFLAENGIESDRVLTHPTRSIGLYAISLTDGERSFSYWRDTSAAKTLADDADQLAALTQAADVIHISGITLAILSPEGRTRLIDLLQDRRSQGVTTVLDPNIRLRLWESPEEAAQVLTQAAKAASVVLPSFDDETQCFADQTPAETCIRYAALGADVVVVKNGTDPIEAYAHGETLSCAPFKGVKPVDTTGAGDSFNGAFLARWVAGAPITEAVQAAQHIAQQVVLHAGALVPMQSLQPGN